MPPLKPLQAYISETVRLKMLESIEVRYGIDYGLSIGAITFALE